MSDARGRRARWPAWAPPTVLAAALGVVYLVAAPPAADLAAASYRSDLFAHHGLTVWDDYWYAGHHLPGYSLLSPPLGALLSPRLVLVAATLAAVAVFAVIAHERVGSAGGGAAAVWFALGAAVTMLSGRVPFTLGLALGLGALAAIGRGWLAVALTLAVACSLASPVAAAFLALAGVAAALARPDRAPAWAALVAAALVPAAALALAFPEGGYEPFAPSAFWPALGGVLAVAALVGSAPRVRALRLGALLYALAMVAAFVLRTPVGGNAARLGALFAGPLVAGALWERRRTLLALAAPALLYWQLATPVRDLVRVAGDPSVTAGYYAPLVGELARLTGSRPARVEVPLTGVHAEANRLAGHVLLARGWERQLDTRYGALFYRSHLAAGAYRAWLSDNAVAFVALPDVRLDHAGAAEGRLVAVGLPYLRLVWRSAHWRLYAVTPATPLASPPARMLRVGVDTLELSLPRAGTYTVRVHFTPYWGIVSGGGCVGGAAGGWTALTVRGAGVVRLAARFALARVVEHGTRCR